ncbi:MAG: hypothetical protein HOJ51_15065 [Tateyamaria sp.]|jgi:hypothetical protein|nr:hypothetical protein [Tateyamaria sp.]MBT6344720.1 hypothetical protein [Tateyamaria sp.]
MRAFQFEVIWMMIENLNAAWLCSASLGARVVTTSSLDQPTFNISVGHLVYPALGLVPHIGKT